MERFERYDVFVIDLDGVCYLDGHLFEGVPEALSEIQRRVAEILFVTNNSYRTPEAFARMLTAGPFRADPNQILTSSAAAARLLAKEFEKRHGKPFASQKCGVVVAGGRGIFEALKTVGIEPCAPEEWKAAWAPQAVVVGVDRQFNYERLSLLAAFIRGGADFVATNQDPTYPTPEGLVPGAGAVVAAVEVASGQKARVAGKPHWPMVELVSEFLGNVTALVVGDRWDTDLAFAHRLGFDSALVLSGVGGLSDAVLSPYPPTFVARSLPELLENPAMLKRSKDGRVLVEGGDPELARAIRESVFSAAHHGPRVDPDRTSRKGG